MAQLAQLGTLGRIAQGARCALLLMKKGAVAVKVFAVANPVPTVTIAVSIIGGFIIYKFIKNLLEPALLPNQNPAEQEIQQLFLPPRDQIVAQNLNQRQQPNAPIILDELVQPVQPDPAIILNEPLLSDVLIILDEAVQPVLLDPPIILNQPVSPDVSSMSSTSMDQNHKDFACPLTERIMVNPYTLKCRHDFSKEAIENYLKKHDCCPKCQTKVRFEEGVESESLQNAIRKFHKRVAKRNKRKEQERIRAEL